MTATTLLAIDWGTTSARAYRVGMAGAVLEQRSAALGVQNVQDGRFAEATVALLGDWRNDDAPCIACGMVGSRQGWCEAPYIDCPAPLAALAGGIVTAPGDRLAIVPGVRTRDHNGMPDVIRGEETQLAGAVEDTDESVLAVLPGTHSKWARVERGQLVDFSTYMTGELFGVLLAHTILGRLAQPPGQVTGPGFERGVARGLGAGALNHDLFGARTLALMGELAAEDVADWLSGLLIGREVRNARAWAQRAGLDGACVRLIGSDALVPRYRLALAQADIAVELGPDNAAAIGLWRIARAAGIVH